MAPPDRAKLTLVELRRECRDRGARTTGRKAELLERLESYDRNDDFRGFGQVVLPETDPMPEWPSMSSFCTITKVHREIMPKVRNKRTGSLRHNDIRGVIIHQPYFIPVLNHASVCKEQYIIIIDLHGKHSVLHRLPSGVWKRVELGFESVKKRREDD
jgi:hypothetical protein